MPASLVLVFGGDEFKVSAKAREVLDSLAPADAGELAREIVQGYMSSGDQALQALDRCEEALQTGGLFAAEKTVFLKQATFLGTDPVSKSESVKTRMTRFTALLKAGLPAGHSLLVSASAVDKRSAFYNVFKKTGEVHEFAVSDKAYLVDRDARAFAGACLKREGVRMGAGALDAFVEAVGTDSRTIAAEASKLALYVGESGTASREDVATVTSTAREAMGWDLADAVGQRDLPRALSVVRRLLAQRAAPVALSGMVARRVDDLLLLREAVNQRWVSEGRSSRGGSEARWTELPPPVAALYEDGLEGRDLRKQHPYRCYLLARQAGSFTLAELEACRRAVLEAQESLVTHGGNPEGILETMLVRMLARG